MNLLDHPEARSMLSYMDQHPGEAEPALVFADWAEEHGFPAHAEMIRLHHSPESKHSYFSEPGGVRGLGKSGLTPEEHHQIGVYINAHSGNLPLTHRLVQLSLPRISSPSHTNFYAKLPKQQAEKLAGALTEEGGKRY